MAASTHVPRLHHGTGTDLGPATCMCRSRLAADEPGAPLGRCWGRRAAQHHHHGGTVVLRAQRHGHLGQLTGGMAGVVQVLGAVEECAHLRVASSKAGQNYGRPMRVAVCAAC